MKKNTLSLLIVTVAVLSAAAVFISANSDSSRSEDQSVGKKLLPLLSKRINDISSIEIINNSGKTLITKSTELGAGWIINSKDRYPAKLSQIRKTLIDFSELKKVEAKTKKQKNYSILGVQDVSDTSGTVKSRNSLLTLKVNAENIVSIIIGNNKSGQNARSFSAGGAQSLSYVRLNNDKQVWLVSGNANLPDVKNFMDTELTNIPVAQIQAVRITHPKGAVVNIIKKDKSDKEFTLKQLAKNKELVSPGILTAVASALTNFNFDDVSAKTNDKKFENPVNVEFTTFEGLTVKLNLVVADDKNYLWLDAVNAVPATLSLKQTDVESKGNTPDSKQQAIDINKKHSHWLYVIPAHKAELLTKQIKDLIKDKDIKSKK